MFFGNYAEVEQDLLQARRYTQEALKISAIEEESRLTAEMILKNTDVIKEQSKLKSVPKRLETSVDTTTGISVQINIKD